MSTYINQNGVVIDENDFKITPRNRSFRYGDGCFETMKVINGNLINHRLHLQRFFSSLDTLKIAAPQHLDYSTLVEQVIELCKKNLVEVLARVRLMGYRSEDNNQLQYVIEALGGEEASNHLNKNGLTLDFFVDSKKASDKFSAIKSNNYQVYAMAALWAKEKELNDAIVCNTSGRIAETSIANIFIVQNGLIKTPPLSEGCVDGVMRKYLIQKLNTEDFPFEEAPLTIEEITNASEVFLTNAIIGIRWVEKIGNNVYSNQLSSHLYKKFISPLFK